MTSVPMAVWERTILLERLPSAPSRVMKKETPTRLPLPALDSDGLPTAQSGMDQRRAGHTVSEAVLPTQGRKGPGWPCLWPFEVGPSEDQTKVKADELERQRELLKHLDTLGTKCQDSVPSRQAFVKWYKYIWIK